MEKDGKNTITRRGKQYTVVRNCKGNLTAEEFVIKLLKAYKDKEYRRV